MMPSAASSMHSGRSSISWPRPRSASTRISSSSSAPSRPASRWGPNSISARSEDKDAVSAAKIKQLRVAYLAKARRNEADGSEAVEAIETYFATIAAEIRQVESSRLAAEPSHLKSLERFAERAYRRPLSTAEKAELVAFYHQLRRDDGLSHEDAIRDTLTSVLLSPHFCYRVVPLGSDEAIRPLPDHALASRLSYFLWSSMPDEELLSHAAAGDLHEPAVLLAQTRRMLRDPRIRGLATEFAWNWLDYRRFEEHNGVDRDRFAQFSNDLRQAMFEEPVRFIVDLVSENRSVLEGLHGDYTFVNPVLARHYGLTIGDVGPNDWVRVDDVQPRRSRRPASDGRFPDGELAGTAHQSRESRGYWVVRRLLGERIPAPPAEVPELPKDEASTGELSLPQLLARHRDNVSCAGCHQRFDSIGLVFEGYGPIGERRDRDLGGRPIDARATFPDGSVGTGVDGLRKYLSQKPPGGVC